MSKNTLVIALCVAAAATAGMTLSRVAFAQPEAGNPIASHNPHDTLETLQQLFQDRSRQELPPFSFVVFNDLDLDLGRSYLILQGDTPGPDLAAQHVFFPTREHVMDVRTLTYSGSNSAGIIHFLKDLGKLPLEEAVKAIVPFDNGPASTTIHFDPPIRIDERDMIFATNQRVDESMPATVFLSLHVTVPGAGGGDVMRIE